MKTFLVMRKFYDFNKSMEFRVFVKQNKVIAISQRDCTTVYEFLNSNELQEFQVKSPDGNGNQVENLEIKDIVRKQV